VGWEQEEPSFHRSTKVDIGDQMQRLGFRIGALLLSEAEWENEIDLQTQMSQMVPCKNQGVNSVTKWKAFYLGSQDKKPKPVE
jgi:hypothetical protein